MVCLHDQYHDRMTLVGWHMVQRRTRHRETGADNEPTGVTAPQHTHVAILGTISTVVGPVTAVLTPRGIGRLSIGTEASSACFAWLRRWMPAARVIHATNELAVLEEQLTAYLAGEMATFTIPVDLHGTPFQIHVWKAVQEISYGEVTTYGQLAKALGRPGAARAVGAANGANPVPILIPCHRLVGHNGALISYRGGVAMKRHLLQIEGVLKDPDTVPRGNTIAAIGRTRR